MVKNDFIEKALSRFKVAAEATDSSRAEALDDVTFSLGEQWPQALMTQRQLDSRPCLVMNHIKQFLKQVGNDQRQQRPAAQINPVGSESDIDTAEIIQGIVRHIEVNSEAEMADDLAFDQMLRSGFGFLRVLTEYENDESDDQEIKIEPIENQFSVYFDPAAKASKLYSNARYCFIVEDIPFDEYKAEHGDSELAKYSADDLTATGDMPPQWASNENGVQMVRRAEYFYVETEKNKKGREVRKVKWVLINGVEVLEERDWMGKYIPVIPVLGESVYVDGKQYLAGMVRDLKDPQRMYNYWVSKSTEAIALAPLAPFVIAEGQMEGHETEWSQANTRMMAALPYKPTSVSGTMVPAPQRQVYEPPIQAVSEMTRQADNDMKAAVGIYDASLGQKGPDQSGKAILARQNQANITNLNWSENLSAAIRYRTRILIDLIRKVYPPAKIQRIIKPDQTVDHVGVYNSKTAKASDMEWLKEQQAIKKIYDIGVGEYDVTVSVGPSFQTKRQEAAASQLEFLKLMPPELSVNFLDLVTGNMDWPQAQEFAKRAKKLLPPAMQDDQADDPEAQVQKLQGQLQALSQQHEQLTQMVEQQADEIKTRKVETDGKVQIAQMQEMSRQEIVKMQEATKIAVAQINASKDANQVFAEQELEQYKLLHGSAHERAMQSGQQSHESQMADQNAANQSALADQNAQNQAQQQAGQQSHEQLMAQQAQESQPEE